MRSEDVKIGMKVVPHEKSFGWSWGQWVNTGPKAYFDSNGFLFVDEIREDGVCILGSHDDFGGDYFLTSDFEPYEESSTQQIKTMTVIMPL